MKTETPYTSNPNRLADVLAAIQTMAIYRIYKQDVSKWAEKIIGSKDKKDCAYWENIFKEHPEFFRFDLDQGETVEKVSLIWRRSKPRRFHIENLEVMTLEDIDRLPKEESKSLISRSPLTSSEIQTLISVAIELQSKAFESKKDKRWWIVPLITSVSGLIGVLIGLLLK